MQLITLMFSYRNDGVKKMKLTKQGFINLFMVCVNVMAFVMISALYQIDGDLIVTNTDKVIGALTAFTMFILDAAWLHGAYSD